MKVDRLLFVSGQATINISNAYVFPCPNVYSPGNMCIYVSLWLLISTYATICLFEIYFLKMYGNLFRKLKKFIGD